MDLETFQSLPLLEEAPGPVRSLALLATYFAIDAPSKSRWTHKGQIWRVDRILIECFIVYCNDHPMYRFGPEHVAIFFDDPLLIDRIGAQLEIPFVGAP
jgi:hypothetical protein